MKRIFSLLLAFLLILTCVPAIPLTVQAATTVVSGTCGDNLTWTLYDGTLTISGTGTMKDYNLSSLAPWHSNRSSIKKVIVSDSVTSIGSSAFQYCTNLTSITIGDGITNISRYAFSGCTSLTSITIPDGVTSIGDGAFHNCTALEEINFNAILMNDLNSTSYSSSENYVFYKAGQSSNGITLNIGTNVTKIPARLFYSYYSSDAPMITTINFAAGSTCSSIGDYAFYNCTGLEEINFNAIAMNDLSSSNYVFYKAGWSGNGIIVNIGADVTKIPAHLFYPYRETYYAPKITAVNFAEDSCCTSIGGYAFNSCSGLTNITIPDSVNRIGDYAFYNCTGLEEINFNATAMNDLSSTNNVFFRAGQSSNGITVNIGANVTRIPAYLFDPYGSSYSAPKTTKVIFAEGSTCTSIGKGAFRYCASLACITIPDCVTNIGTYVFYKCSGLTEIRFDGSAPIFGNAVFYEVTADAYYNPDETWTEEVRKDYGGKITWVAMEKPAATVTFKDESGNVISQATYVEGAELVAPTVDEIANGRSETYIFEGWGADYTGICQGEAEYTAIGTGYTDLQEALKQDTEYPVTIVKDLESKYVTVRDGVTLDLNGHALNCDYFTCYGDVIDSSGGDGLVKAGKRIHVAGEGSHLPIFDTSAEGYRFFAYELENLGFKAVDGNDDAVKLGFRLKFENANAYSVLAQTEEDQLDVLISLRWNGLTADFVYQFSESTLRQYASLVKEDFANKGSSTKVMTLTIIGMKNLGANNVLQARIGVDTTPGVTAESGTQNWQL